MRIARFAAAGQDPAYGILELAVDGGDHPDSVAVITGDPLAGVPVNYTGERHALADVRLLAPVIPRSKVVAVGKNYADHAAEMGGEVPVDAPLVFLKPNTSVIGPGDPIVRPAGVAELSYEGELAIVIGRICKEVPPERVPDVIFGYTVANDVTARDWQRADGQWSRAKGSDTFCPLGPWINTHLTIAEAENLGIETRLNDEVRQQGNTSQMVRGITELVTFITSFTTLLPGDVILTGTPAGVGVMADGDVVHIDIDGFGTLSNPVAAQ
ncbi:fumarylacetoacetate hydrolase family protein [Tessaracoccus sp. OS52]|uniref:fumarylacetoacetate hydrolase family protein n=1 Tax=Tessaracoccus sp. OS52 TaxID=2886691 RepID=UPI001D105943|nr:fumarylacetoacetate hydrolase family protein [Tessaracoccus sp. OS52]MCC2593150.1 fumarylacetoacetate hydrolase family protein [Tessaracoccus sp. OS52]